MAKQSKRAKIHEAFAARFRSEYLVAFGAHADPHTVNDAWKETPEPMLEANFPAYEQFTVTQNILFINAAVITAIQNLKAVAFRGCPQDEEPCGKPHCTPCRIEQAHKQAEIDADIKIARAERHTRIEAQS